MILNNDQLKNEARHLALSHDPYITRKWKRNVWQHIEDELTKMRSFIEELNEEDTACTQPVAELLLDHAEFIEEQALVIKEELCKKLLKSIPYLSQSGEPRVLSCCEHYIEHTDGLMQEKTFIPYIQAYQEVSVLYMSEIWAIPLMMRIALIRKLSAMMDIVRERRKICRVVEEMLDGIRTEDLSPETLKNALESNGYEMPLSGSLIVHLVRYLRERTEDMAAVGEWLLCKLDNGLEDLDQVLTYEYQLQAENEVTLNHYIQSLRRLSRWDWSVTFEQISMVEMTLREEKTTDYEKLDYQSRDTLRKRVEYLARRMKLPEKLIASQAVQLANEVFDTEMQKQDGAADEEQLLPRKAFVAYYLLDAKGLKVLRSSLKKCGEQPKLMPETGLLQHALGTYFHALLATFSVVIAFLSLWIGWNSNFTPLQWVLVAIVLIVPATEWAVTMVHWMIERLKRPLRILRYDFSQGVPADAATMVVIPIIWSSLEDVQELTERLELHYLANRSENLFFALLADFADADQEMLPEDERYVEEAKTRIDRLNEQYGTDVFFFFQRKRKWNPSERCWMGWERKRGKLVEFVELLKGHQETSYEVMHGNLSILPQIKYVITLDADTRLPLESAHRIVGAMHLPYNRPRLNATKSRVVEGYGVLQPRIGMTHEAASKSRLASLWMADPGVDPYAFAVSDPYQDGLGEGIFTGKGIFSVNAFYEVLCERIPENRVLSHDLLEGGFLRAGLLSDIELIDDHPAQFSAHQKRMHRWIRGDWQLLIWLLPKNRNRRGEILPVDLSILTRWQIMDNLRRSLLPPTLFIVLWLGLTVFPGSPLRWMLLVFATMLLPIWRQLATVRNVYLNPKSVLFTLGQIVVEWITLPFQTVVILDAIFRTLYRLWFSKRRLLEWVASAEVERRNARGGAPTIYGMTGGYLLIALFLASSLLTMQNWVQIVGVVLSAIWALAPIIIRWLDQPIPQQTMVFSSGEIDELTQLSREIWNFYEEFVTKEDNWLPPDNVQFEPVTKVAHRTSPTNIGLYLASVLAARDFGFIDTPGMIQRLERTVDTLDRMDTWNGHLYNWYDTITLKPLMPKYVSTVDSGNFVGCLIALKEGVTEWLEKDATMAEGERSDHRRWSDEESEEAVHRVAFAEEITPTIDQGHRKHDGPTDHWVQRGKRLVQRLERWINETDFRPLFDHKTKLFSLGYLAEQDRRDEVLYDLLASEARQASFIAIALGQVSVAHWHALGRTMTKAKARPVLLSWSGTMFEYLLPWLFMRTYPKTIWDMTYHAVVDRQIEYARQRQVPFGISESGYYAFDYHMNYQYKAFGVPGLGFKRGLEEDLVVSSYATILALPYARREGLKALKQMKKLGAKGKYGYYEAIDFTPKRMPKNKKHVVVRSFMAHHQGMSMLTLANLLHQHKMIDRFHRFKQIKSAQLLLQERIPKKPKLIKHPAMSRVHTPMKKPVFDSSAVREFVSANTVTPEVCVLSNGTFTSVVTNSGSGLTSYEGLNVSRWREDPVTDPWGNFVYIRDVESQEVWSPSFQPCHTESADQRVQFSFDRATFYREHHGVKSTMEICVPADANAEVRRITLENVTPDIKMIEVTTFVELSLAHPLADDAHPAFNKLFIRTSFDEAAGCLIAERRTRDAKEQVLWSAHILFTDHDGDSIVEYETDRSLFIGRGHQRSNPKAIHSRLKGTTGSVADPVFVMRERVNIAPGEKIQFFSITSVAKTREEAVQTIQDLSSEQAVNRAFQLAWRRVNIELRNLNISNWDATGFQVLAGKVLYTPPFRRDREKSILANVKGQSGLWSFGISGERPVVIVRISDRIHLPFVVKLLIGHEYLRRLGILFDLVLLNESDEGYHQHLQEALQRAAEQEVDRFGEGMAGIYVIDRNQIAEEERHLLLSVARMIFHAGGASLLAQMKIPRQEEHRSLPDPFVPLPMDSSEEWSSGGAAEPSRAFPDPEQWKFYNGYGGFSEDGRQYHIVVQQDQHLPAPWINVLANPKFGCLVSELGTGYAWWRNSREFKLTPWSNDPVIDPPTEIGYLRDEESGQVWSTTPAIGNVERPYYVTHGLGFSRFVHQSYGIQHEMDVFVPLKDPVKIMKIKLKNITSRQRKISLTYYAEWVLGVQRLGNAPMIFTEWDDDANIMTAQNHYQEVFREATAFLGIFAPSSVRDESIYERSWTSDRLEFIGRNRSQVNPAAMERVSLSGRTGVQYDSCGALQVKAVLNSNEERTFYIVLGCDESREAVSQLARKYAQSDRCEQAFSEVKHYWEHILGQITVSTPSPEMNFMLNGWLLYQSIACRMFARTAFYQAGGAYGFRDQLQDSLAILHTNPEMTKAQILRNAAHQYKEGDVQHWWHEETERGIRTLFSDDLLWLPYAVSRYMEHTGDESILDEIVPFIESEPLREGELERYEPTVLSAESGSIYEHCVRAIDHSLRRIGEHDLPLIGVGDWNDGMSMVGAKGRGESVWLTWFLCDVLQRFVPICQIKQDEDRIRTYQHMLERFARAVDEHAWDGKWYRRAFTDNGTWLGSVRNEECRIDAIAQSWAVISEIVPENRSLQAMQSLDRELVDRELSVIHLLTPPFDQTEPSPGYIQGYPPGIRENGGQYTHGVIWSIIAWCKLGNGDKAFEYFHMLTPINHTRTDQEVRQYRGEPYVMAADVYTAEPHEGRAGWTWYTGASGWMYQAGIEWILGLQRRGQRLYIRPCLPSKWPGYSVTYRYGRTNYFIHVVQQGNEPGQQSSIHRYVLDGKPVQRPDDGSEPFIEIIDDGQDHHVEWTICKKID